MKKQIHIIRSADRTSGVPESFRLELNTPIHYVEKIKLLSATLPTNPTDYYYIQIEQFNNIVNSNNTKLNYATFVIPHHHIGVPSSDSEYNVGTNFTQEVTPHSQNLYYLTINLLGDNGDKITGIADWSFVIEVFLKR